MSDLKELLREAVDRHPAIAYGSTFRVVDSNKVRDWLADWIPRVQRELDKPNYCDRCEFLNIRLNEIEKQLGIYGTPLTIEMEIENLHEKRRVGDEEPTKNPMG